MSRPVSFVKPGSLVSLLAAAVAALAVLGCQNGDRSAGEAAASEAGAADLGDWYPSLDDATVSELEEVRRATAGWTSPDAAMEDGYLLLWASPSGDMVRYVDRAAVGEDGSSALDLQVERTRPEILVYVREDGDGAGWRLAAVEYALPKTEPGSTRPAAARDLFTGVGGARWREYPTRESLGMNVKWSGYGECHYEGGAEIALAGGPGYTYVRLPPGAMTGESWDGPPVTVDDCAPVHEGQDLLVVHGKLWRLRAWTGVRNPRGPFRATNPDA